MNDNLFSTTGISLPSILHSFGDCVAVSDKDFNFVAANKGMASFYRMRPDELVGKNAFDVYPQFQSSIFYDNALRTIKEGKNTSKVGYSQNTKRWMLVRTANLGNGLSALITSDIDLATLNIGYSDGKYDTLTALKNRDVFEQDLKTIYEESRSEFGVVFVDIRNFRAFNCVHGMGHGDRLLLEVASRLRGAGGMFNQVYRISADKFAVILPLKRDGCIFEIHRMHALLHSSFTLGELTTSIETSIAFMYVDMFMHKSSYIMEEAEFALSQSKMFLPTQVYHEHILSF